MRQLVELLHFCKALVLETSGSAGTLKEARILSTAGKRGVAETILTLRKAGTPQTLGTLAPAVYSLAGFDNKDT